MVPRWRNPGQERPQRHLRMLAAVEDRLDQVRREKGEGQHLRQIGVVEILGPGDMFGPYARQAKADPAWRYFEMDASHSPHVTAPAALAAILNEIVG